MIDENYKDILLDAVESMMDSIIVDKDNKVVFFSESYAKDTGVNAADIIGKNVCDVISNTRMHLVVSSGEAEVGEGFVAHLVSGNPDEKHDTGHYMCNRIPVRRGGKDDGEIIGAFAYSILSNPKEFEKAKSQLKTLSIEREMLKETLKNIYSTNNNNALENIKGTSDAINILKQKIRKIAGSTITVSVIGETGVGKELVTSAIHELSERCKQPFVKINCAAIPDSLLESELFGYEPGAFTGASKNGKMGKFELANHGTILLDEIGEMPLFLQAKLLRVLQEKEIEHIGGKTRIPIDVRIICSTNQNLSDLVKKGRFRKDLYYRLSVMVVNVPPLRDRLDDIPDLCNFFIDKCREKKLGNVSYIDPVVFELFRSYTWPGNVRELEHVIECACVISDSDILHMEDFSFMAHRISEANNSAGIAFSAGTNKSSSAQFAQSQRSDTDSSFAMINNSGEADSLFANTANLFSEAEMSDHKMSYNILREQNEKREKALIINAITKNKNNLTATAKYLGISRSTLYRKMALYNIE